MNLKYWLSLLFLSLLILLITASRVVLGQHTLDQALYGLFLGLWLSLFLFHYVRPSLSRHIRTLLDHPVSGEFSSYAAIRNSCYCYSIAALMT